MKAAMTMKRLKTYVRKKAKLLAQIKHLDHPRVVEPNLDLMELRKRNQALSLELETLQDELKKQKQKDQRFQQAQLQAQIDEQLSGLKAELQALQLEKKARTG